MTGSGILDWSDIKAFHISELVGFRSDHPKSIGSVLANCLYDKINIRRENVFLPQGCPEDFCLACTQYEETLLGEGGLDLALLALGRNGSIAFNEPGQEFMPVTHVPALSQTTVEEYISHFSDRTASFVPKAITLGMSAFMSARKLIVLALGFSVSDAAAQMINGNVSPSVPASMLQMHNNAVFILDEAAATKL